METNWKFYSPVNEMITLPTFSETDVDDDRGHTNLQSRLGSYVVEIISYY